MKKISLKLGIILGGLLGLILWVQDYDFFVNFISEPETPLSDAIMQFWITITFGIPIEVIIPAIVLILVGMVIGGLLQFIFLYFRQK